MLTCLDRERTETQQLTIVGGGGGRIKCLPQGTTGSWPGPRRSWTAPVETPWMAHGRHEASAGARPQRRRKGMKRVPSQRLVGRAPLGRGGLCWRPLTAHLARLAVRRCAVGGGARFVRVARACPSCRESRRETAGPPLDCCDRPVCNRRAGEAAPGFKFVRCRGMCVAES